MTEARSQRPLPNDFDPSKSSLYNYSRGYELDLIGYMDIGGEGNSYSQIHFLVYYLV